MSGAFGISVACLACVLSVGSIFRWLSALFAPFSYSTGLDVHVCLSSQGLLGAKLSGRGSKCNQTMNVVFLTPSTLALQAHAVMLVETNK